MCSHFLAPTDDAVRCLSCLPPPEAMHYSLLPCAMTTLDARLAIIVQSTSTNMEAVCIPSVCDVRLGE
uniref:Uncharacterized protein n=1 Tax=Panagrellus redivivus TaxID=6233 RepID=A0A7E5A1Q0_PANRE